ncbi:DUF4145 domain-containing protein [Candidatus Nitrosotenuis chungbukensis]|uniref:DUF4145 domain-containing protein n=1 Tax=Candidatus Nitrosotenuis chungbukensis TaxID=1353246 RepID=UPI0005B2B970|nr:DUF4145 domain-containing protein [Candidatus Nitrosotenuis chungbukensis]
MDFIGPSKCDEARMSREMDIENVWKDLTNNKGFVETYALFGPTIDFFREAQSCYQNSAYMATALMCRATTEIGIYYLVSRYVNKYSPEDKTVLEIKKLLEIGDQWRTIFQVAKTKCDINENLELVINEIREAGNFVAHYAQKMDKRDFNHLVEKESWFTRDKALEILKKTVLVINHLLKHTYERLPKNS